MAKKKILKLTDEQYYKYIMSLKNESIIKSVDGETQVPDSLKKTDDGKNK